MLSKTVDIRVGDLTFNLTQCVHQIEYVVSLRASYVTRFYVNFNLLSILKK